MKIKNLIIAISVLFFFSNSTLAQNTYVPDDNFEQALIDLGYDTGELNDSVPTNSINTITALNISGKNIVSLIGIEGFLALTELNFSNNQLSSVDLSSINNLSELICYNNQLTELDLYANIIIENINCANNNISELDLSSNTLLKYINCSGNQLTTLNIKNSNNTLMTGDDYRVTGIDTRNNSHLYCTQVDNAEASKTYATWFKDTWTAYNEDCTAFNVKMAYVPDDNFEQALIDFGYDSGALNDSVPTTSVENITVLNIANRNIADLTGIEEFKAIEQLHCYTNQITSINLSTNTSLNYLNCSSNQITTLELGTNTLLTTLICSYNEIIDLDVSNNTFLTYLNGYNNQLTSLNVRNGNNSNLRIDARYNPDLFCIQVDDAEAAEGYSNWNKQMWTGYSEDCSSYVMEMTYVPDDNFEQALIDMGYDFGSLNDSVPTTAIKSANYIYLNNKNISDLTGIEYFTNLTYLSCYSNQLTELNLNSNILLKGLNCSYNRIIELDLSSNSSLTNFTGNNNQLTGLNLKNGNNSNLSIDVRNNPNLLCIQVDDAEASYTYTNWYKNTYTGYSEDCSTYVMEMTYVPDDNFEQALIDMGYDFGSINDSVPTVAIKTAGSLNLNYKNISELTGIEDFTNLTYLSCYRNQLTELNLESNVLLEVLNCSNNNLIDLDLSSNSSLTNFTGSNNQLTGLNLKNGNNSNLSIDVRNNPNLLCIQVDDAKTSYTYTNWYKNGYTAYSEDCSTYVMEMTYVPDDNFEQALISQKLDYGPLNDSVPTHAIRNVKTLSIGYREIEDLTGIERFIMLSELICYGNKLTTLILGSNINLKKLYCHSNLLTSLDLSLNINLETLSCSNNKLTNLLLETNTLLTYLHCNDNQLTDLNLNLNTNLENIYVNNNYITDLNLSANTSLLYLDCRYNRLASLNLRNGNNENIVGIDATNNILMCIQVDDPSAANNYYWNKDAWANYSEDCDSCIVEMCYIPDDNFEQCLIDQHYDYNELNDSVPLHIVSSLTRISLTSREIRDATGIENFVNLEQLSFQYNYLDSLNLESNLKIHTLDCHNNWLTTIKLGSNKNYTSIEFNMNNLTELDLSDQPNLSHLNCRNNKLHTLNIKNGNNSNFSLNALHNEYLTCIQVDDVDVANSKYNWFKDDWASYSENCGPLGPGIPIQEYNSLVDLYNSTIGEKWAINDNWLDTINSTVEDWHGVTVEDGHVTQVLLSGNNLQNTVFENHVNLPKLKYLDLGSNSLTGFNFSVIDSLHELDSFVLYQNFLIFEDLIPSFSTYIYPNYADQFYYHLQAKIDSPVYVNISVNEQFAFSVSEESLSTNDQFQWYKEGFKIVGETNSIINFSPVTKADSGSYYLEITNTGVPGLVLKSHYKSLYVTEASEAGVPISEYNALVDFYNSLDGDNWTRNDNWLDTINHSVGDWYGITIENNHVTKIELPLNNIKGIIPAEIGELNKIQSINLYDNKINGPIPFEIQNLNKLEYLNLERNLIGFFSEDNSPRAARQIHDELENLPNLKVLYLAYNHFQFNDIESIYSWSNFSGLTGFSYKYQSAVINQINVTVEQNETITISLQNYFPGPSDNFQWVKGNNIIPGANDSTLIIENVQISDEANYYCVITNSVVPNLSIVNYSTTLKVNGVHGSGIPISEYNALVEFYNSTNGDNWFNNLNWLDTINHSVSDWAGIQVVEGHVRMLLMDSNNVVGILPNVLADLKYLEMLALVQNNITGNLPNNIGELSSLRTLSLDHNYLTGEIPASITQIKSLYYLGLSNNNMDGIIPTNIGDNTNLEAIFLGNNNFSGTIPESIGNLSKLRHLRLCHNELSGTIPASLGNLTELRTLILNNNQLVGPLPVELKNLTKIYRIDIDNNLIGDINSDEKSVTLTSSTVENNRQIPDELAELISMDTLQLGNNQLQFNDIEAIFSWDNFNDFNDFIYSPQDLIGVTKTVSANTEETISLSMDNYYPGNSDEFQWYKNGSLIPNAKSATLSLSGLKVSDAGEYNCKVTNPVATELTLTSKPITLNVTETIAGAGVPLSEYLALVEIYDSTNGNAWTNNLNWLDTITVTVSDWFGVTVENGHVTIFEMPDNNLSKISGALKDLSELKKADFSSGNFSGEIPNLGNLASLDEFSLANNNFIFNDLIPIADWINYNNFKNNFSYSPQSGVGETESLTFYLGDSINLEVKNHISDNSDNFEWFRNGISIQNSEKYNLEKEAWFDDNNAVFLCEITNSLLPDLTLISEDINVTVNYSSNDSLALINLRNEYEILQEIWTNDSIFTWPNITFENGFVTAIDFSGLNLEGTISPIFSQFDSLVWLNLSSNNLSGEVPLISNTKNGDIKSISSSEILTYLNIANNNFRFIDLETNASDFSNIDVFIYAPQQLIGQPLDTSIYKYDAITFEIKNFIPGSFDINTWFKDGQEVIGKNDLTFTIENAALQDSGYYTCSITNTLFADLTLHSDTSWLKIMIPVGTDDQKLSEFKVYPNPAKNRVFIDTKNETIDLKIFNLIGNLVLEKNNIQSGWIDIKQVTRGVYVFRITRENSEIINRKVIFK